MPAHTRCGVLLVNTGTPSSLKPKAVRKYLGKFLLDKRIAPMNRVCWWLIVHLCILPVRGRKSGAKYEQIWTEEGSPFTIAHEKLVHGLSAAFAEGGYGDVVVRHAMSYSDPGIQSAFKDLAGEGCSHVVVLPLYPQSAHSTTGSVHDGVERAVKKTGWKGTYDFIDNYHDNPMYIKALAASIKHAGFDPESDDQLLLSFHSIPLKDIEAGDTYELQTGASSLQIASELGIDRKRWTIGYQCRFDKGREWLSPYTTEVLARWAEAREGRVFFVCPGFAVDCLETIYDIGAELKPFYEEKARAAGNPIGDGDFVYVPCLDRSKAHAKVLFDVTIPYVKEHIDG